MLPGTIPVIINNFNRYASVRALVQWLQHLSVPTSLVILDNHSTYPPLLEYYDTLNEPGLQVVRLKKNHELGMVLPSTMVLNEFEKYVVTDADLLPYPSTPPDMLEQMMLALDKYPYLNHVGASLEVQDIPAHYPLCKEVRRWEQQYWCHKAEPEGYRACIDTTFAMYRRTSQVNLVAPAMRLDRPYTLRHLDWYIDPDDMTEEYRYYLHHCTTISTWNTKLRTELSAKAALPA
ncbi:hypothetical protein AB9P05_13250 [Roseivirga sp. BDSF3-8]|uniref:hypothetical protein n=1 Tax=Roseivirga sp. BDSF3-8 TaxID=3241598 RepID=UPI0035323E93